MSRQRRRKLVQLVVTAKSKLRLAFAGPHFPGCSPVAAEHRQVLFCLGIREASLTPSHTAQILLT